MSSKGEGQFLSDARVYSTFDKKSDQLLYVGEVQRVGATIFCHSKKVENNGKAESY